MLGLPESPKPDRWSKTATPSPSARNSCRSFIPPAIRPGGICLYSAPNCFTGDTLFAGGVGRTDFPGGSTQDLLQSIRTRLLTLPAETIVWPGHGYGGLQIDHRRGGQRSNPFLQEGY